MKQVRAKFKCNGVTKRTGWGGHEFLYSAEFNAVMGDSDDNKQFFAATPSGEIKLSTVKEDHFQPGKEYYVDFVLAED